MRKAWVIGAGRFVCLVGVCAVACAVGSCVGGFELGAQALVAYHNSSLDADCQPSATIGRHFLSKGTLDVMFSRTYDVDIVVENLADEPLTIESVVVTFTTPPNVSFAVPQEIEIPGQIQMIGAGELSVYTAATLPQEIGEIIGRSSEFFDPRQLLYRRGSIITVLISIRVVARTLKGAVVHSNLLNLPLDICAGCLIYYVPGTLFTDDDNSLTCDPAKNPNPELDPGALAAPCRVGQDEAMDCRFCRTQEQLIEGMNADTRCDP